MNFPPSAERVRRDLLVAAVTVMRQGGRQKVLATGLRRAIRLASLDALTDARTDVTAALSGVTEKVRSYLVDRPGGRITGYARG